MSPILPAKKKGPQRSSGSKNDGSAGEFSCPDKAFHGGQGRSKD